MLKKKQTHVYGILIVAVCVLLTGAGIGLHAYFREKPENPVVTAPQASFPERFLAGLKQRYPAYHKIVSGGVPDVFHVLDQDGAQLCRIYLERITDEQRKIGYAGTIEVALITDREGKTAGVLLGDHQETSSFIERIRRDGFMDRWNGLPLLDIPDHAVECVSGATLSCDAIRYGVRRLAEDHSGSTAENAE